MIDVTVVPLSRGCVAFIDDDDAEWVLPLKWYCSAYGYAVRDQTVNGGRRAIYMARAIMGAPSGLEVDHINGDPLDNRKANLRIATHKQNGRNRKQLGGTSRYKGVCWDSRRRKWKASIGLDCGLVNIGRYDNEVDAARAYDRHAMRLYGEYARPNFEAA